MFCAISSFVTVFKKLSAAEASESVYMRERVKDIRVEDLELLTLSHLLTGFQDFWPAELTFENITAKEEIAHNMFNIFK